jgi:hypothetical protein
VHLRSPENQFQQRRIVYIENFFLRPVIADISHFVGLIGKYS